MDGRNSRSSHLLHDQWLLHALFHWGGRTGVAFLKARFWRLVPTLMVCATLTAAVETLNILPERSQSVRSYLANLACLPLGNLLCDAASVTISGKPVAYSWVDGAYWSLLVEIRLSPVVVAVLRSKNQAGRNPSRSNGPAWGGYAVGPGIQRSGLSYLFAILRLWYGL